jgi:MFS family permease
VQCAADFPNVRPFFTSEGFLLVPGIGFGMMYLPSIVMVGYYFDKKRAMATGIAVCGSGIGTFIFAPLASYLVREYTWKVSSIVAYETKLVQCKLSVTTHQSK